MHPHPGSPHLELLELQVLPLNLPLQRLNLGALAGHLLVQLLNRSRGCALLRRLLMGACNPCCCLMLCCCCRVRLCQLLRLCQLCAQVLSRSLGSNSRSSLDCSMPLLLQQPGLQRLHLLPQQGSLLCCHSLLCRKLVQLHSRQEAELEGAGQ